VIRGYVFAQVSFTEGLDFIEVGDTWAQVAVDAVGKGQLILESVDLLLGLSGAFPHAVGPTKSVIDEMLQVLVDIACLFQEFCFFLIEKPYLFDGKFAGVLEVSQGIGEGFGQIRTGCGIRNGDGAGFLSEFFQGSTFFKAAGGYLGIESDETNVLLPGAYLMVEDCDDFLNTFVERLDFDVNILGCFSDGGEFLNVVPDGVGKASIAEVFLEPMLQCLKVVDYGTRIGYGPIDAAENLLGCSPDIVLCGGQLIKLNAGLGKDFTDASFARIDLGMGELVHLRQDLHYML